jgi:hypothetical protein
MSIGYACFVRSSVNDNGRGVERTFSVDAQTNRGGNEILLRILGTYGNWDTIAKATRLVYVFGIGIALFRAMYPVDEMQEMDT